MEGAKKPFWEESYKRKDKLDTFGGGKPSKSLVSAVVNINLPAKALDLGCGEGRNALYIAKLGFETLASDISESGIAKLKIVAKELHLNIDATVCDMRQYEFKETFNLIICTGCLHLIHRQEWQQVIKTMKLATHSGGINVVGVFTDEAPEPEDQRGMMVGLFKEGELLTCYQDWEILEKKTYIFEHTHPDGPTHKHAGNEIIARKP
jgi:tellurite methyltransferase